MPTNGDVLDAVFHKSLPVILHPLILIDFLHSLIFARYFIPHTYFMIGLFLFYTLAYGRYKGSLSRRR